MKLRIQLDHMCSICKITGSWVQQEHDYDLIDMDLSEHLHEYVPDDWTIVFDEVDEYDWTDLFCPKCKEPGREKLKKAALQIHLDEGGNEADFDFDELISVSEYNRGVTQISLDE